MSVTCPIRALEYSKLKQNSSTVLPKKPGYKEARNCQMEMMKTKKTSESLEKRKALGELEGVYEISKGRREEIGKFLERHDYLFSEL